MLDFITERFTEISLKCLERNAKEQGAALTDMALVFKLDGEGEVEYMILKNYQPVKTVTFLEVLGVRIDFKGYSLFVPKFIQGALNRFCQSHKIEKSDVRVLLTFTKEKKMVMWLYNKSAHVEQVTLDSLFDATDIMES